MEDFNQTAFFGELRSTLAKNNDAANRELVELLETCPDPHFLKNQVIPYCAERIAAGPHSKVKVTLSTEVQLEEILKNPAGPLITSMNVSEWEVIAALMEHLEACGPEDFPYPYLQSISLESHLKDRCKNISALTDHTIPHLKDITLGQGLDALCLTCVVRAKWPNLKSVRLKVSSHKEKQIVSRALSEQGMRVHVS